MLAHVFIVESPKPFEILHKRTEGEALNEVLSLTDVNHKLYRVVSEEMLDLCFAEIADQCKAEKELPLVFIHLAMHGHENGICLTSGQTVPWGELRKKVIDLARRAGLMTEKKALVTLCLATCFGLCGTKMNDGWSKSCFLALNQA